MIVHADIAQGSDAWRAARMNKATASDLGAWVLGGETKAAKSARQTLICKKLGELGGEEIPDFDSYATKRGKMLEPEARSKFAELMDTEVEEVGFCEHDSGMFGCSPDGLLKGRTEGVEIKCPLPATHVRYLLEGVLPDDYLYQVHGSLAATGLNVWWFMSYAPGLPALIVRAERNETTEQVLKGCLAWGEEYRAAKARMAALWEDWKHAA